MLDQANFQHKVRLAGIDAPEKSQPFGNRSKESLSELVFGKMVSVESNKTDKYGRKIGKIQIAGVDANLMQVRRGYAWHYKAYENEQPEYDRALYSQAEINARIARAGLWRDTSPIAPWDFRRSARGAVTTQPQVAGSSCPCDSGRVCTGPRGGIYCFTSNGKKHYQ